ncbi:DUF3892 domain-containing protein [Pseudactinotalea sp. Z1732]|uniref:DUF3892 domain-containing protein n=1 Tax=Micrococcales TaxID=85006 RepID=UPI003C7B9A64
MGDDFIVAMDADTGRYPGDKGAYRHGVGNASERRSTFLETSGGQISSPVNRRFSMMYIRKVRLEDPGTLNRHITAVQFSFATTGTLRTATLAETVAGILAGQQYRSHNDATGAQAPVVVATSVNGLRYITTVADGRESNNLLELPRF